MPQSASESPDSTHAASAGVSAPGSPAQLGTGVKLRYGAGGFADNLAFNCVNQLGNPVYNLTLGISPALIGLALAVPRIVDAFLDPFIGLLSDNHRSRWGRRREFIAIGAICTGLAAGFVWWPPSTHGSSVALGFLFVIGLLLAVAYSIFTVPYYALGVELTNDSQERNALMAWRAGFNKLSGVANQWLFALAQLAVFGGILTGARVLGVAIALVVIALGLLPALTLREPDYERVAPQLRLPFWDSMRGAFRSRDFRVLVFSNVALLASVMMVDAVGLYLMIFHVCGGDMREAGLWKGVSGTVFQVGGVCSLPLINWLCRRYEKKVVSRLSIAVVVAAGISKWFFYAPGAGWLVVVPSALLAPGLAAVLMLGPSMLADLCEVDQAEHGVRREGMFVATFYWLLKTCTSVIMLLSGVIIAFTGFRAEAGTIQSTDTILLMRLWFSGGTIALAVTSFVLLGRYTLTAEQLRTLRARTLPLAL